MSGKSRGSESELWSYVGSGDGMHCPFHSHCRIRLKGNWCPDDNKKHIEQLFDHKQFRLSSYDSIGRAPPGGTCRIGKITEIVANEYLKRGKVDCPPVPTELVLLADEKHPIEIHLLPLKVHHGAIWHLRDRWVIQLRNNDTPATQRFFLFHEAFHILAHCNSNTSPSFRKRGTRQGSFNEMLADFFAACILMPQEWVNKRWAEVKDLEGMAEIFDVPKSVAYIRLKRLGLI